MTNKEQTQAMHKTWQDECARLKEKRPGMSARWCANQISKLDMAQGRTVETIIKKLTGDEWQRYVE
jgi:hypothetical protein